jgi:hypothetical protein
LGTVNVFPQLGQLIAMQETYALLKLQQQEYYSKMLLQPPTSKHAFKETQLSLGQMQRRHSSTTNPLFPQPFL